MFVESWFHIKHITKYPNRTFLSQKVWFHKNRIFKGEQRDCWYNFTLEKLKLNV